MLEQEKKLYFIPRLSMAQFLYMKGVPTFASAFVISDEYYKLFRSITEEVVIEHDNMFSDYSTDTSVLIQRLVEWNDPVEHFGQFEGIIKILNLCTDNPDKIARRTQKQFIEDFCTVFSLSSNREYYLEKLLSDDGETYRLSELPAMVALLDDHVLPNVPGSRASESMKAFMNITGVEYVEDYENKINKLGTTTGRFSVSTDYTKES